MLPFELSNGICSLNPREDRLTLTCEMEIDSSGKVVRHDIYESVICSCERLVYEDVTAILEAGGDRNKADENSRSYEGRRSEERADKDAAKGSWKTDEQKTADRLIKKYSHIYDDMMLMGELARILEKKRKSRGSIDFELEESEIILDDRGVPVFVGVSERGAANKMIEEFMLHETASSKSFASAPSMVNTVSCLRSLRVLSISLLTGMLLTARASSKALFGNFIETP